MSVRHLRKRHMAPTPTLEEKAWRLVNLTSKRTHDAMLGNLITRYGRDAANKAIDQAWDTMRLLDPEKAMSLLK